MFLKRAKVGYLTDQKNNHQNKNEKHRGWNVRTSLKDKVSLVMSKDPSYAFFAPSAPATLLLSITITIGHYAWKIIVKDCLHTEEFMNEIRKVGH